MHSSNDSNDECRPNTYTPRMGKESWEVHRDQRWVGIRRELSWLLGLGLALALVAMTSCATTKETEGRQDMSSFEKVIMSFGK